MNFIDLRSDTVTRPNAKMRAAMAAAEVGDDVYGEDPTTNLLEQRAADIFGKEAALFVPSGSMGNTIAIKLHTQHGEEVICAAQSHIVDWELSMMAWFTGCLARPIRTQSGILSWAQIAAELRPFGDHNAATTLVSLENSHNMGGGTTYPLDTLDEITFEAHKRGLKVHMDGARVFNAAIASGNSVARIAQDMDTVMFCLSKALGAPVGSLLVGSEDAIKQARLYRKRLGGGMRQTGVLAAAGLIALEESPARLAADHANAQLLADRLQKIPGVRVLNPQVETNILIFDVSEAEYSVPEFSAALKTHGVLANGIYSRYMRMLTHLDVTGDQCLKAAEAVAHVVERKAPQAGREGKREHALSPSV